MVMYLTMLELQQYVLYAGMNVGTGQVRYVCRWLKHVKESALKGLYFATIFFYMFHVEKGFTVNVRNKLKIDIACSHCPVKSTYLQIW